MIPAGARKTPTIRKEYLEERSSLLGTDSTTGDGETSKQSIDQCMEANDSMNRQSEISERSSVEGLKKIGANKNVLKRPTGPISSHQRLVGSKQPPTNAVPAAFFGKPIAPATSKLHEQHISPTQFEEKSNVDVANTPDPSEAYGHTNLHSTEVTSDAPQTASQPPLPPGWLEGRTDDGRVYYFHSVARISRWNHPHKKSWMR